MKAATRSGPSSRILASKSATLASQNSPSDISGGRVSGLGIGRWCTSPGAMSMLVFSAILPLQLALK